MNLSFPQQRPFDVICLGRAGIDLYANEHNTDLDDVSDFKKYIGGSPANIAVALSRLGAKTGFISCLSKDGLGDCVRNYLNKQGIDLSGVQTAPLGSRTSLAVTEMKPSDGEVVIYRNDAADLMLQAKDIDPNYTASAKLLLISGTALSASPSREATLTAMHYARENGTLIALDIDYRAYSWESPQAASLYYKVAAGLADIVIGNREEYDVLEHLDHGDNKDDDTTAQRCLQKNTKIVVIKAGERGSKTYTAEGDFIEQGIFPVSVVKPFGSGDAFAGTLLYGLLNNFSLDESLKMGAASAAINVSKDNCTEAMPDLKALQQFIQTHDTNYF